LPLLALAFLAFVGLGLPDPLPGALWPELRPHYGLPQAMLGLVLAAMAAGYIAASLLAGRAMLLLGIGGVLALSVAATATAALGQALAPPWAVFMVFAVLAGLGGGAVDAALNTYAALHFAPRHLNWLHACWGLGATLGPAIATGLLAAGAGWQAGYAAVGLMLAALSVAFALTRSRWQDSPGAPDGPPLPALGALRQPAVRLRILVFFLMTGVEASTGQWVATVLVEARGATPAFAAATATLFWAGLALGRVGMGLVVDRIGADRLVRLAAAVVPVAAIGFAVAPHGVDLAALAVLAVALSPLFPTLVARTPARLGAATALHAVGFQVAAATLGVAILPAAIGLAVQAGGAAVAPPAIAALAAAMALLVRRLG
jgi:fucose permease